MIRDKNGNLCPDISMSPPGPWAYEENLPRGGFYVGRHPEDTAQPPLEFTVTTGTYTPPAQMGWECPKCGTVHAPWVPSCRDCKPSAFQNTPVTIWNEKGKPTP